MKTNPRRLPSFTTIAVAWMGHEVPAWIERGSRRVYTIVGEIGFGAAVLVIHRTRHKSVLRSIKRLQQQLQRWGYRSIAIRYRKPDNQPCRRRRASRLMDGSTMDVDLLPEAIHARPRSPRRLAAHEPNSASPAPRPSA